MTAILLPALLLAVGGAVDFQRWGQQRKNLQDFADTLALRGAREFMLANADAAQVKAMVESIAASGLKAEYGITDFSMQVAANKEDASVYVSMSQAPTPGVILTKFSPYKNQIEVGSSAVARGGMNVCVVALEESANGAISGDNSAVMDAADCSVLSNSNSSAGIIAKKSSEFRAEMICSAGGADGGPSNFTPAATTDCPVYPDPLSAREAPAVGGCDYYDYQVGYLPIGSAGGISGVGEAAVLAGELTGVPLLEAQLSPGVYCGGLEIFQKAYVTFEPGVYVIKDGPLKVGKASTLKGENIAFHLVGDASTFAFEADASISMTAPKLGPLAGILFFEDRAAPLGRIHSIKSNDARNFLGTFYLPRGTLEIDTSTPVADTSAYTAIVANRISLKGQPTLVLNANYGLTDIPAPPGVGPVAGEVFLRD